MNIQLPTQIAFSIGFDEFSDEKRLYVELKDENGDRIDRDWISADMLRQFLGLDKGKEVAP
jgi:hypothetical protein